MYNPTNEEIQRCADIIGDALKIKNVCDCMPYVDEIFKIIYAIGGDYSEQTIKAVVGALYESGANTSKDQMNA